MDFELLMFCSLTNKEIADNLVKILKKVIIDAEISISKDADGIYLGYELFSMSLLNQLDFEYIEEDYGIHVNSCIDINLFPKTYEEGLPQLFRIIGEFIKSINGNILFLGNGSIVLMKMTERELVVNNNSYYNFEFPFNELGIDYILSKEIN